MSRMEIGFNAKYLLDVAQQIEGGRSARSSSADSGLADAACSTQADDTALSTC